jgi:hypothetical protein
VAAARSGADGGFELRHVAPGRYFVRARHPHHAAASSPVLDVAADREGMRLELAEAARLHGRVRGMPAERRAEVFVMALGGVSTLRKVGVDEDGRYALEAIEPGIYAVHAFLGATPDAFDEQIRAALARDAAQRSDVVLGAGEDRSFDLQLDALQGAALNGSVAINGAAAGGCQVEVRSLDGVRRWLGTSDERGRFAIGDLTPGEHRLIVTAAGSDRQEIHRAAVAVAAGAPTRADIDVRCGALRGRVRADDGARAEELLGRLLVLPGATAGPAAVRVYAREHVVHQLGVQRGAFRADLVLAGSALLVLELRGRAPAVTSVDIPPGGVFEIDLRAGARR